MSFYIPLKPNFPLHNGQIYNRVMTQESTSVKYSFLTRLVPAPFGLGFPKVSTIWIRVFSVIELNAQGLLGLTGVEHQYFFDINQKMAKIKV